MARVVAWALLPLLVLGSIGLGAGGWYYSDQMLPAPSAQPPEYDVTVVDSDRAAGEVELAADTGPFAELDALGLETRDGLVLLEGPPRQTDTTVVRTGTLLNGSWPRPGDKAAPRISAFAGDPATTLGLPYEDVDVPGPLGTMPAWRVVPNEADTDDVWVVLVHGRGSTRAETNRSLAIAADMELPSLSISVRNDPDAPADPDGFNRYGEREWRDLQAAIDHLQTAEDAERFALIGYSQGGSIVLGFLRRSPDASDIDAAVLVSPLVSLRETLELQARGRDIPGPFIPGLVTATGWVSEVRADMDLSQVEHLARSEEIPSHVEMLVTHGDADTTVPFGPSRELASTLDEQVTFERYEGVEHAQEWNAQPERFEADLTSFLDEEVVRTAP